MNSPPPISTFNIAQRGVTLRGRNSFIAFEQSVGYTELANIYILFPAPYLFYARLAITVMVDWALKNNIYLSRCY